MYKYYFFDLDGTLTDPGIGITNSVMHALKEYGITVDDRSQLYPFIGPPLKDSFMKYYGFSEVKAMEAITHYREYFSTKGLFENEMYEGIPYILSELKGRGIRLVLATSKPDEFSIRILKHFGLYEYFDFRAAATMDERRTSKAEVIEYAISSLEISDKDEILMIGDRSHDILGAKANGIHSAGVLYGYGDRQELESSGADYIVEKPAGLLRLPYQENI